MELFRDLGSDWSAYEPIYDPRGKPSTRQQLRLIEFSRLVTHAPDAGFASQVGQFLDLGEVSTFLAAEVLLSNYDGLLATGQNFLLYLDPADQRFGFAPWDLDRAWGEFPLVGTPERRERADIWHPWIPPNRFLERLFGVEEFRRFYRAELERQLHDLYRPDRLHQRLDELAAAIRPWVTAESPGRSAKFETAVSGEWIDRHWEGGIMDADRPVHQLKRFITARAESVRSQLDGRLRGTRLERRAP
jgi:spore coat protein CotH